MNHYQALLAVALACGSLAAPCHAFTVTLLPGTSFSTDTAAMDAALGITGYTVEDFEDTSLIPGLSIAYTNPNAGPNSVLPTVYNEASIGLYTNNLWDGAHALVSTPQNQEWNQPGIGLSSLVDRITFNVAPSASSFGVGLGNFQSDLVDHALLVNGSPIVAALESLPNWTNGIRLRNAYLRIDAEPGEVINSVSIDIGTTTRDGLVFDRLAVQPTPEPGAAALAMLAVIATSSRRRRP